MHKKLRIDVKIDLLHNKLDAVFSVKFWKQTRRCKIIFKNGI